MSRFHRSLGGGLAVVATEACHAEPLERLQRTVFPTLAEHELFRAEHYRYHQELFPEGQYVVVDEADTVVGMTSTLRLGDSCLVPHAFADVSGGGLLTPHDPTGRWLYGVDVGVHPDWRRRGVARGLYAARQDTVRRFGLAGQVTVGMLSGYGAVKNGLSLPAYFDDVLSGRRVDPTVSAQQKLGFEIRGLVEDYVTDPVCGGGGALLVLPATTEVAWPTQR